METDITPLVILAQRGDRDAYSKLVLQFEPSVFAIILARLRNYNEAEELCQQVMTHAWIRLHQLSNPSAFAGWLKTTTSRLCYDTLMHRPAIPCSDPHQLEQDHFHVDTPPNLMIEREDHEAVRQALERLRPLDRDTLRARYYQGLSLDEMTKEFGAPLGTIKRRLHVARHRLKRELIKESA